eukprot:520729_1
MTHDMLESNLGVRTIHAKKIMREIYALKQAVFKKEDLEAAERAKLKEDKDKIDALKKQWEEERNAIEDEKKRLRSQKEKQRQKEEEAQAAAERAKLKEDKDKIDALKKQWEEERNAIEDEKKRLRSQKEKQRQKDELNELYQKRETKQTERKPSQFEAFLSGLRLTQYMDAFTEEGFETMDQLQEINDGQLKEIGILKMGHRLKILKGIRAFFVAEEYIQNEEDVKEDDVARKNTIINALIVCVGIAEYDRDELENLDTANDIAMYRALFEGKYDYKVIANDPSQRMTKEDVKQFLRNVRKDHLYDFDDYKLY